MFKTTDISSVTRGHTQIACMFKTAGSSKCWYPPSRPHGVTTKKSYISVLNTINPTQQAM
jgi:hypothetical protein